MKILSKPNGNAEEYGRWSVNPYKGCPHGCTYCYLKKGAWAKGLGGSVPVLKEHIANDEHAYHVAMAEIIENREQIIKDGGLFMTFTSDPCVQETREVFFRIVEDSTAKFGIPVTILTKNADFINKGCYDYREKTRQLLALGWTLTGHDEMEPNASSNLDRIVAMQRLSKAGYKVWASIEPVIDFASSREMIRRAVVAGCLHFKVGLMTERTKVCRKMYDHDECVAFIHDVMRLVRKTSGEPNGTVTVYWKQSFRDYLGEEDFARATVGYENIVGKEWSMFEE